MCWEACSRQFLGQEIQSWPTSGCQLANQGAAHMRFSQTRLAIVCVQGLSGRPAAHPRLLRAFLTSRNPEEPKVLMLGWTESRISDFVISTLKLGFWMLGDAFEVRKAASSVGFAGERPDDSSASRRRPAGVLPCRSLAAGCHPDLKSIPERLKS